MTRKEKIPLAIRNATWSKYIGASYNSLCFCCNFEPITKVNYECGHIISEKHGGKVHLNNLRPICSACNKSVGTKNMEKFMEEFGLEKNKNWYGYVSGKDIDGIQSNKKNVILENDTSILNNENVQSYDIIIGPNNNTHDLYNENIQSYNVVINPNNETSMTSNKNTKLYTIDINPNNNTLVSNNKNIQSNNTTDKPENRDIDETRNLISEIVKALNHRNTNESNPKEINGWIPISHNNQQGYIQIVQNNTKLPKEIKKLKNITLDDEIINYVNKKDLANKFCKKYHVLPFQAKKLVNYIITT